MGLESNEMALFSKNKLVSNSLSYLVEGSPTEREM